MSRSLIIALIQGYRLFLSPLKGPTCRFYPSCSCYTQHAVQKYGVVRGLWRGLCRLARCHPYHPGGYDPVR